MRIYTLLQGYQTLVREIATPTLTAFVTACLQLLNPSSPGKQQRLPPAFVETVVCALSTVIPLYPTTVRPFAAQIRSTIRIFLAPTSSDSFVVPQSLRNGSRKLLIALHHTAAKNSSSEEWTKGVSLSIKDCHETADMIFRAVQEYWESATGRNPSNVSFEGEVHGGGESAEELPPWTGMQAGGERLIGLFELLEEHFKCATRAPVAVPLGELIDLALRITLIKPPSPSQSREGIQLNAAIGREEKDELWTILPDLHSAALRFHLAVLSRLGEGAVPFASDIFDQAVRVFQASRDIPAVREIVYTVVKEVLTLAGPTLPKLTVDSAAPIINGCCRDILQASGYLQDETPQAAPSGKNANKAKEGSNNADAFLNPQANSTPQPLAVRPRYVRAAEIFLVSLYSHVPQRHLSPDSRGLMDRTAILSHNRDAMVASCVFPYKDKNGRYYPSILPFLTQQFPHDQAVEVLRTNLRGATRAPQESWDPQAGLDDLAKQPAVEESASDAEDQELDDAEADGEEKSTVVATTGFAIPERSVGSVPAVAASNAFMIQAAEPAALAAGESDKLDVSMADDIEAPVQESTKTALKRKGSKIDSGHPKRLGNGKDKEPSAPRPVARKPEAEEDGDGGDSDSEGSIEIDPTFSDEDEDDEQEEE